MRTERNIVIEWGDVKHRFIQSVEFGQRWDSQPVMGERLLQIHKDPSGFNRDYSWEGGTGAETLEWLKYGYFADEFEHSAAYVPMALKDHVSWSDEDGDPDAGRLIGGYEDFYLGMSKQERKPGIRVMVQMAFASGMGSETLRQYGAWVAGLLGALEASGYDITVDIWVQLDNLFDGDYDVRSNVLMRVKRENEVSDFTEWSVLFSPTGYRHVVFTAKCVAGDKIGRTAAYGLGRTIGGRKWGLDYDPETSTLKITVDQRGAEMFGGDMFPKERLNQQALDAGLIAQPMK